MIFYVPLNLLFAQCAVQGLLSDLSCPLETRVGIGLPLRTFIARSRYRVYSQYRVDQSRERRSPALTVEAE
ncbi:hypothetical protein F5Y17DRAFT_124702 [Xylariaceae sp. FL0594]|nr:hypothetical protein F5Y17DRAFT_124702 [Xylariaceae sp. FL0594]